MPADSPGERRVVDQRALHLLDGYSGLHDLGFRGAGQFVGLLDDEITHGDLERFVAHRAATAATQPRPGPTHGDRMLTSLVCAAPDCQVVSAGAFDDSGQVFRPAIVSGMEALCADHRVRVINVSLEIVRLPQRCSSAAPCRACLSLRQAVDQGRIVVAAGGNQGEKSGAITCPAAESRALLVGATVGPQGSSAYDRNVPVHTETGTSVSAAMVSGGITLLLQALPGLTLAEIRAGLSTTATLLPSAPQGAAGAGRAHFFRAFRYLEHRRCGGQADVAAAERLANEILHALGLSTADAALPTLDPAVTAAAIERVQRAIQLAPWSGAHHLWLGLLLEQQNAAASLLAAEEAVRLDWSAADTHALLSRVLRRIGDDFGGGIEQQIAGFLRRGEKLAAADALFAGLRTRAGTQAV